MSIHRPCFILAIVLCLGIMAGTYAHVPLWAWLFLGLAGLALFFVYRWDWIIFVLVLCLGAVCITQRNLLPANSIAFLPAQQRQHLEAVQGMVDSEIQQQAWAQGRKTVFELSVRQLLVEEQWQKSSGKIRVELFAAKPVEYGQVVTVRGKLHLPFDGAALGGFSYRRYLQEQGIFWILSVGKQGGCNIVSQGHGNILIAKSIELRHWMIGIFYRYLVPREAGFVAALVLGDRSGMPKDLNAIFVNTGTAHILAISGMNMAIVGAIFLFVLRLLPMPRAGHFLGAVLFLFAYAFLSGWSASVVRACIMSSVIFSAFAFEQESEALNSLGIAALVLLFIDPHNLFDIGFQLSFAAVAAILILYSSCERMLAALPLILRASIALSLSAWAGTAGIILYHFHMITPISILANIPIVPLADMVMAMGLGLAAVGGWSAPLAYAFANCLKAILSLLVIFATWFNQAPYGHFIFQ